MPHFIAVRYEKQTFSNKEFETACGIRNFRQILICRMGSVLESSYRENIWHAAMLKERTDDAISYTAKKTLVAVNNHSGSSPIMLVVVSLRVRLLHSGIESRTEHIEDVRVSSMCKAA